MILKQKQLIFGFLQIYAFNNLRKDLVMLETLNQFFASTWIGNIYLFCAIGGTVCFFVFTTLAFALAGSMDADADFDISPDHGGGLFAVKIFSLHSVLSFLMFFGWGGVLLGNHLIGFIFAIFIGGFTMLLTAYTLKMILKLQDSGAKNDSFLQTVGTVYLTVQESPSGVVTLNTSDGIREIKAISSEPISSGVQVRVIAHVEGNLYRVEKI